MSKQNYNQRVNIKAVSIRLRYNTVVTTLDVHSYNLKSADIEVDDKFYYIR